MAELLPKSTLVPYTTLFRSELVGERADPAGVLALRILGHHDLDAVVAALGREPEGPRQRPSEERGRGEQDGRGSHPVEDRKSTRLNSSHLVISYAVFCLKKK